MPASEVAKQFGDEFAAKLGELSPGQWQGPIESGYGRTPGVRQRTHRNGRVPPLDEVRDAVAREWANARRLEANEKLYEAMLDALRGDDRAPSRCKAKASLRAVEAK